MTAKKQVLISFDPDDLTYLEGLAERRNVSIQELVHRAVYRAHLTEKAKERHKAYDRLRNMPPIDWGMDWPELKEEMERERYKEIVFPEGAEDWK